MSDALEPGIYSDVAEGDYHADPSAPSLSASIAKIMCNRSPLHAWERHPRLNPDYRPAEESKFDRGTAAHALLLEGSDRCAVIDADSWRTNAAKDERDAARAAGRVPLLAHEHEEACEMVEAVRRQLDALEVYPPLFTGGGPEQTLVWDERGVRCRARLDWLRDDRQTIDDLKTTGGSADPREWARRRLWDMGADVQVAMNLRGVKALTAVEAAFRFVVVENQAPYGLSVVSLAPSALELANAKVDWALDTWRECIDTDTWPSYPTEVAYADVPPWEEMRWLEAHPFVKEAA
jgi:hypothetical protein